MKGTSVYYIFMSQTTAKGFTQLNPDGVNYHVSLIESTYDTF